QMLDQRFCAGELGACFDQCRLQCIYIFGQLVRCRRHTTTKSQTKRFVNHQYASTHPILLTTVQPAATGRHVCWGFLQSIPSSMEASCAEEIEPPPAVAEGQMTRPRSNRLA